MGKQLIQLLFQVDHNVDIKEAIVMLGKDKLVSKLRLY